MLEKQHDIIIDDGSQLLTQTGPPRNSTNLTTENKKKPCGHYFSTWTLRFESILGIMSFLWGQLLECQVGTSVRSSLNISKLGYPSFLERVLHLFICGYWYVQYLLICGTSFIYIITLFSQRSFYEWWPSPSWRGNLFSRNDDQVYLQSWNNNAWYIVLPFWLFTQQYVSNITLNKM